MKRKKQDRNVVPSKRVRRAHRNRMLVSGRLAKEETGSKVLKPVLVTRNKKGGGTEQSWEYAEVMEMTLVPKDGYIPLKQWVRQNLEALHEDLAHPTDWFRNKRTKRERRT